MTAGGPLLAIDTATATAVVALGEADGRLRVAAIWPAGQRHSEELLPRIETLLRDAGVTPGDLGGVIVGTGPGAFTGLRVGLATAKTLAHELGLPLVGVSTAEALLAAVIDEADDRILLLPAGAADRVAVRPGRLPERLVGGREPDLGPSAVVVAVDLANRADPAAVARGGRAQAGLAGALVHLGAARLAAGATDDVARLVPEYVTLPRGVASSTGGIEWSRDHR
jgi:tRNA threonylcarbamoyl adenosine modification protein YeaZ